MSDPIPCEFFLIRYVPNLVTQDFINIGVLLREVPRVPVKGSMVEARFTSQWRRLLRLDPDADIDLLESLADDISNRVRDESTNNQELDGLQSILDLMRDSFSNSIQISGPHGSLADTFEGEMDRLMRIHVEPWFND